MYTCFDEVLFTTSNERSTTRIFMIEVATTTTIEDATLLAGNEVVPTKAQRTTSGSTK